MTTKWALNRESHAISGPHMIIWPTPKRGNSWCRSEIWWILRVICENHSPREAFPRVMIVFSMVSFFFIAIESPTVTCAALQSGTWCKAVPDRFSNNKFLLRKYCAFRTVCHSHSDHTAINMRGIKIIVLWQICIILHIAGTTYYRYCCPGTVPYATASATI